MTRSDPCLRDELVERLLAVQELHCEGVADEGDKQEPCDEGNTRHRSKPMQGRLGV